MRRMGPISGPGLLISWIGTSPSVPIIYFISRSVVVSTNYAGPFGYALQLIRRGSTSLVPDAHGDSHQCILSTSMIPRPGLPAFPRTINYNFPLNQWPRVDNDDIPVHDAPMYPFFSPDSATFPALWLMHSTIHNPIPVDRVSVAS